MAGTVVPGAVCAHEEKPLFAARLDDANLQAGDRGLALDGKRAEPVRGSNFVGRRAFRLGDRVRDGARLRVELGKIARDGRTGTGLTGVRRRD